MIKVIVTRVSPNNSISFSSCTRSHRKLGELDLGKFNHKMINPKSKPTTVKKTIDKNGKKTWTGTKALKDTQP